MVYNLSNNNVTVNQKRRKIVLTMAKNCFVFKASNFNKIKNHSPKWF